MAAAFGLRVPPSYKLKTIGGRAVADEVFVDEHSVLLFMAAPRSEEELCAAAQPSSDSEGEAAGPASADPPSSDHEPSSQPGPRDIRFTPQAAQFIEDDFEILSSPLPGGVLGIVLYAPYYQEDYLAVFLDPARGDPDFPAQIRLAEPRIPLDLLDNIVPVEPLPDPGFGAFLAFPSILDCNGLVAVIIDLRPVLGNKFAAILPQSLSFEAWDRFIRVLLPRKHMAYDVYIGSFQDPIPFGSNLNLQHGTLIVTCPAGLARRQIHSLAELLTDYNAWRMVGDMPKLPTHSGICILSSGEQRWYLCRQSYPNTSLVEAVEKCTHAKPGTITIAPSRSPHLRDICLHGRACKGAVMLARLPPPGSALTGFTPRDDAFLFVDYRPVGVRPHGMHQLGTTWSIGTILAKVPAVIPEGFKVHIDGGYKEGDTLLASSGSTVTVFLARCSPDHTPATGGSRPAASDEGLHPPNPAPDAAGRRSRSRSRSGVRPYAASVQDGADPEAPSAGPAGAPAPAIATPLMGGILVAATLLDTAEASYISSTAPQASSFWEIGCCMLCALLLFLAGCITWVHCRRAPPNRPSFYALLRRAAACAADKLLDEPIGNSPRSNQHLTHLRALTNALGGRWLRDARPIFPGVPFGIVDSDEEGDAHQPADTVQQIHCAVLKNGHTPEFLCVPISVPATQDEAEYAVQAARSPEVRRLYPSLLPVTPNHSLATPFTLLVLHGVICYRGTALTHLRSMGEFSPAEPQIMSADTSSYLWHAFRATGTLRCSPELTRFRYLMKHPFIYFRVNLSPSCRPTRHIHPGTHWASNCNLVFSGVIGRSFHRAAFPMHTA